MALHPTEQFRKVLARFGAEYLNWEKIFAATGLTVDEANAAHLGLVGKPRLVIKLDAPLSPAVLVEKLKGNQMYDEPLYNLYGVTMDDEPVAFYTSADLAVYICRWIKCGGFLGTPSKYDTGYVNTCHALP